MTAGPKPVGRRRVLQTCLQAVGTGVAGCAKLPTRADGPATETQGSPTNSSATASFTASPRTGLGPVLVELDATSAASPTGDLTDFQWAIDDLELQGPRLYYPFESGSDKRVRLTVTDTDGVTATHTERLRFQSPAVHDYPTTGVEVPSLAVFDEAVLDFMAEHRITSAALGVAKNGEVVLERGYGWKDRELTEPTAPDALFRIGSVTKPFAAALVKSLVRSGTISLDDRVFPALDLDPLPGDTPDDRLFDVTVEHLLEHRGGWDPGATFDPVFYDFPIARAMDLSEPPTPRQVVRYMLGQPLQFDPGERSVYSNFGYLVLGVYAAAVTARPYARTLRRELLTPNGIEDVVPGRTLPARRDPRESRYFDPNVAGNVLELDPTDLVHLPDGGFHLEKLIAVGDLVAPARGLLSFLDAFWLTGEPRGEGDPYYLFSGSQPGVYSMVFQFPGGIDVAVLFNRWGGGEFADVRGVIERAVDDVEAWP